MKRLKYNKNKNCYFSWLCEVSYWHTSATQPSKKWSHVDSRDINNFWMFHIYSKKSAHKQWMGPKTPNKQQGNTQYEKTLQVDVVEGYA